MQHSQKKNASIKLHDKEECYREKDQKKCGKAIYRKMTRRLLKKTLLAEVEKKDGV